MSQLTPWPLTKPSSKPDPKTKSEQAFEAVIPLHKNILTAQAVASTHALTHSCSTAAALVFFMW